MSFGYIPDDFRRKDEQAGPIGEHLRGRLVEISAVFDLAFQKTELALARLKRRRDETDVTPNMKSGKRRRQ